MGILINRETKVIIQGITGKESRYHTRLMLDYGTRIVAGVTPGKGGQEVFGIPVYSSIADLLKEHSVDVTGIFVPARFSFQAVSEAIENNIKTIVFITEGVPLFDMMKLKLTTQEKGIRIIGPNTPGLLTAGESKIGILAAQFVRRGNIGVISRSGTLTAGVCQELLKENLGQTTVVGIGGDPIVGTGFIELLKMFEKDPETEGVVLVGEVGGNLEEEAAEYIKSDFSKPVVALIVGRNVPEGKRMGHAGAIIERGRGSAKSKIKALEKAGVPVANVPWEIGPLMKEALKEDK